MSDDSSNTKKLSLSGGKLTLGNIDTAKLRTGPSIGGARKTVQVEVRRKRAPSATSRSTIIEPVVEKPSDIVAETAKIPDTVEDKLTAQERAARVRALQEGMKKPTVSADQTKNGKPASVSAVSPRRWCS